MEPYRSPAGEEPVDDTAPVSVVLPHGIHYDGDIYTTAVLREMGNEEEKILGTKKPDVKRIVRNCLLRVGEVSDKRAFWEEIIPNMTLGDFSRILISLRVLSLGPEFKYKSRCPHCGYIGKFSVDVTQFETVWAKHPDKMEYPYQLRNGKTAYFRPVLVKDQDMLVEIDQAAEDQLTEALAMRLVRVDDELPEPKTGRKGVASERQLQKAKKALLLKHKTGLGEGERIRMWFKERHKEEVYDEELGEYVEKTFSIDAKVDSTIEDSCQRTGCRTTWKHRVEFDPSFLLPSLEE